MKRFPLVVLALGVLCGCDTVNDTMVRRVHQDHRLGYEVNEQIMEGLRRRMAEPSPTDTAHPAAPSGLDQG